MENQRTNRLIKYVFIALEVLLYLFFMINDIQHYSQDFVTASYKYGALLLCFLFVLFANTKWDKQHILISIAFLFTAIADFFLLFMNSYADIGIACFIVVQATYLAIIHENTETRIKKKSLSLRVIVMVAAVALLYFTNNISLLNVFAVVYFINLVINCLDAWLYSRNLGFAIGLSLFVLCDICVALFYLTDNSLAALGMWFFYLPSQVLISISNTTKAQ